MWIFSSPKNYSEMVEKISKSTFVISLFLLYFLTCVSSEFSSFMDQISFEVKYNFGGLQLNFALFYIPLAIGTLEHVFKIHDKISEVIGIRKRFDKCVIAKYILSKCLIDIPDITDSQVKKIMSEVFYKYTSSTNPVIDRHYIDLALNEWCWYWITLDTLLMFIIVATIFLVIKWSFINLFIVILIVALSFIVMLLIKLQAKQYSKAEIDVIFSDNERVEEIKKVLEQCTIK